MNIQNKSEHKNMVIGLVVIILLSFAALYVLLHLWVIFTSIPLPVQATIGATVLTVAGSVGTLIYSTSKNRQREIEQALYEKKQPIYESLMGFMFDVLKKSKAQEDLNEQEVIDFIMQFSKELMLWGSDDVIKAYIKWRTISSSGLKPKQMLLALEELFLAIRLDFGHKNKGIGKGDLLSFIIIDMEEIMLSDDE